MRMTAGDAMEIPVGLRLPDRAADHTYCHNYPGVILARELRHLQCWSNSHKQHSQKREEDKAQLCGPRLPTGPTALPALGMG